jgi:23S rRNA (cytosine1962-C5)-methyltransferase
MKTVIDICTEKVNSGVSKDARRLFHGRGHQYPGYEHVVVNWFPPYLQLGFYEELPEREINDLVDNLLRVVPDVEGVVVQFRLSRKTQTKVWFGEVPQSHIVFENEMAFRIQPQRNQNVGLFMDMAHVREALAPKMRGAKVLNLFAYTCAFSVSALAQGAKLVVNCDMNANMLNVGKHNHQLNNQDLRDVRMLPHDVFKSWKKINSYGPYDVVIVDPPTNQRGSFVAEKDYPQLLKQVPKLVRRDASVVLCLNSPFLGHDFLFNLTARWCPQFELQKVMPAHEDFPEAFPDRGLKVQQYKCR